MNKWVFSKLPPAAQLVVALFGAFGAYEFVRSLHDLRITDYASFGLMLFLAVVTAHTKVRLIGGSTLSLLTAVVLGALMNLGREAAVLVAVGGVLVQCLFPNRRIVVHNLVFNLGMITLTVLMAGFGYEAASDPFIGAMIASLIYYLGNSIYVSIIVSLSTRKSVFRLWHDHFLYTAPSFFLAGTLAFIGIRLASSFHPIALIVVVPILYFSYYSYRVYLRSLEEEKKHAAEMATLYSSTLSTLALAIDAKDRNTHGHIQRVQKYARAIAEAMRLEETQIEAIAAAALLHDIGKLAVPEYILSKKGPLTAEEMDKMRMHPKLGADIISNIKFPYPVADSILAHHERFDGTGYPNKLRGKDIPLGARVLAVVDVFDAYTSDRNSDSQETIEVGMEILKDGAGSAFDPEIVAVWESIYKDVVSWKPSGSPAAYTDIQRAASEDKIALETARREAISDKLTGLSNRRAFEALTSSLAGRRFSVVLIDVNSFKAVNDNFGHAAGDAALVRIASHLRSSFKNAELLCRLGGDEFVVVTFMDRRLLRRQIRAFRRNVVWDPEHEAYRSMRFGVSCGVSHIPTDAKTMDEALHQADERMYAVKIRFKEWGRTPVNA